MAIIFAFYSAVTFCQFWDLDRSIRGGRIYSSARGNQCARAQRHVQQIIANNRVGGWRKLKYER